MCNLSQGIKEDGIAIGFAEGKAESESRIILTMHNHGLTAEQIAAYTGMNIDDVITIIEEKKAV